MKRPYTWFQWMVLAGLLLLIGQVAALTWLAPRYIMRMVEHSLGGTLSIGTARFSFPLRATFTQLHLIENTTDAGFSVQRVIVKPRAFSLLSRTLRLQTIEIERPFLRATRLKDGTIRWPSVQRALADTQPTVPSAHPPVPSLSSWRIDVDTIKVVDGVIEFFDERPSLPFHGILDHVSFIGGPITLALDEAPSDFSGRSVASSLAQPSGLSFAGRTLLVGEEESAASLYCSGWLDTTMKDLQASCRLEPIALAAFESYYRGPSELRVSTGMVSSTSQWWSRSNDFTGRIQLELFNFSEDLSVRGRTIIEAKKTADGKEPHLSGEVHLTGPFDNPHEWHAEFLPGDDQVQQLIKRLLDRGVEMIKIPFPGGPLHVSIAPSSKATMTDIEAASREVQEALEILSSPAPEPPSPLPLDVAGPSLNQPLEVERDSSERLQEPQASSPDRVTPAVSSSSPESPTIPTTPAVQVVPSSTSK